MNETIIKIAELKKEELKIKEQMQENKELAESISGFYRIDSTEENAKALVKTILKESELKKQLKELRKQLKEAIKEYNEDMEEQDKLKGIKPLDSFQKVPENPEPKPEPKLEYHLETAGAVIDITPERSYFAYKRGNKAEEYGEKDAPIKTMLAAKAKNFFSRKLEGMGVSKQQLKDQETILKKLDREIERLDKSE